MLDHHEINFRWWHSLCSDEKSHGGRIMQLRDVMTRDVEVVRPESTLAEAARKMKELDVGPIPVCDDNQIIGMITDRDIATRAVAEGRDPKQTQVREVMTEDVVYCFEDQDIDEAARLMRERQVRRLLVLNRSRELTGIVSLGDLAVDTGDERLAGETLEDISSDTSSRRVLPRVADHVSSAAPARSRDDRRVADESRRFESSDLRPRDAHTAPSSEAARIRDLSGRQTIAGLFPERRSAELAIDDLKRAGFSAEQIGVVIRDNEQRVGVEHHKETHAAEGAVTGVLGGGVLGGLAGYLLAIGALTIPGIGPVLAGGALAEALGVVAGTAALGAGIGAAAGGLVGVLVGMGIPEEEAQHFEHGFGAKEALVTVKAGHRIMDALAILERHGADTGVGRRIQN
jgi:CBS domain-containing protein